MALRFYASHDTITVEYWFARLPNFTTQLLGTLSVVRINPSPSDHNNLN